MLIYAQKKAKLGDTASQAEIARSIHITPECVSLWKQKEGFEAWLEDAVSMYRAPLQEILHGVAVNRAHFDFNFWKELAIKYGFIEREEVKRFDIKTIPSKEELSALLSGAMAEMEKVKGTSTSE